MCACMCTCVYVWVCVCACIFCAYVHLFVCLLVCTCVGVCFYVLVCVYLIVFVCTGYISNLFFTFRPDLRFRPPLRIKSTDKTTQKSPTCEFHLTARSNEDKIHATHVTPINKKKKNPFSINHISIISSPFRHALTTLFSLSVGN